MDIDDYSGSVDLGLRSTLGGACDITTVLGSIVSAFHRCGTEGRGQLLALRGGNGTAHISTRTFKGNVRVRRAMR